MIKTKPINIDDVHTNRKLKIAPMREKIELNLFGHEVNAEVDFYFHAGMKPGINLLVTNDDPGECDEYEIVSLNIIIDEQKIDISNLEKFAHESVVWELEKKRNEITKSRF